MSKLPDVAAYVVSDLDATIKLIRKLQRPLTSPNWEQESLLLARQLKRTREACSSLERALVPPKPA